MKTAYSKIEFQNDSWVLTREQDGVQEIMHDFPLSCCRVGNGLLMEPCPWNYEAGDINSPTIEILSQEWDYNNSPYCPIKVGNKWGFIDQQLSIIVSPIFDFVGTIDNKCCSCHHAPEYYHIIEWNDNHCHVILNGESKLLSFSDMISISQNNAEKYIQAINAKSHFSVNDFIDISKVLLPTQYRQKPWSFVNHGTGLLSSEEQLLAYIAAYGEMHVGKCIAAFQNFPFDSILSNFEIVDWGCGQGLATLCFIDMLRDRDMLHLLRKVTLIEPSSLALERAYLNVTKATDGKCIIEPINKYLPGNGTLDELDGLSYTYNSVFHFFSNILDIDTVNLQGVATIVANPNENHHIFCMGPMNSNSYRIGQFGSIFNVTTIYSDISQPQYAHTSTNWTYSCRSLSFEYNGQPLTRHKAAEHVAPSLIAGRPILNDYDPWIAVQNELITPEACKFYDMLSQALDPDDSIFLSPDINGDKPDIVIVRPHKGIMIIDIFNKNLNDIEDLETGFNPELFIPLEKVNTYQDNILKLHLKELMTRSLYNHGLRRLIKKVVYFPNNNKKEVGEKYKGIDHHYISMVSNDVLNLKEGKDFFRYVDFEKYDREFDSLICNHFLLIISPLWHSYKQGKTINLTKEQKELARSEARPRRKVNGVAGSGKTQVLANRAVNAHLRTGKRVLVLTYNLSLVNYIKYRIGEVRADFSWEKFYIINYHQFFKAMANNYGLKITGIKPFRDENFFEAVKNKTEKFATILIDEIQDYEEPWLKILTKYFLEPDGEFAVFGDVKQNVYCRELDENQEIKTVGIPGKWNNSLNNGFRFTNGQMTKLAIQFQKEFFNHQLIDDFQQPQLTFDFSAPIHYVNVGHIEDAKQLEEMCLGTIQQFGLNTDEFVILAQSCDVLRDIDYMFRSTLNIVTHTTFESKEQYKRMLDKHGIANEDSPVTSNFIKDINEIRRSKKVEFSMTSKYLKLSTIHSFKGWESAKVILFIEPEGHPEEHKKYTVPREKDVPELIYTAITRARETIFVINMGNDKYDSFFKSIINS